MAVEDYFDPYDHGDDGGCEVLPSNHGQPWNERGDSALVEMLKKKWPIDAVASRLGRSTTAIEMRIEWLATADERKKKLTAYIAKLVKSKKS